MSITITITDVSALSEKELLETAEYLQRLAGKSFIERVTSGVGKHPEETDAEFIRRVKEGLTHHVDPNAGYKDISPVIHAHEILQCPITNGTPPSPSIIFAAPTPPPLQATESHEAGRIDYDTDGKRWDAAIHSRTKSKTADGRWKVKRGLEESDPLKPGAKSVEALEELKIYASAVQALDEVAPLLPPGRPYNEAPPAPEAEALTFPTLMVKITGGINTGRLTREQVLQAVTNVGLASIPQLAEPHNAQYIPKVNATIDALMLVGGA